jgi:hypothetical protein
MSDGVADPVAWKHESVGPVTLVAGEAVTAALNEGSGAFQRKGPYMDSRF